jgi:catechol 2,3-dioxygenase-like lactoylglutathione lyase family enzyme
LRVDETSIRNPQWRARAMAIEANHYVLAVHDVKASAKFYVEKLGFEVVSEPAGWIFVKRDNVMIMLGECPDDMPASDLGCHSYFAYLRVEDADAWFAEIKSKRAEMLSQIEDKPWGMREFAVRTPDGHRITIGQRIEPR